MTAEPVTLGYVKYSVTIRYQELCVKESLDDTRYETEIWTLYDDRDSEPYDLEKIGREGFWHDGIHLTESGASEYVAPSQILKIEGHTTTPEEIQRIEEAMKRERRSDNP